MRCSQCGFENRDGVHFCEECGAKLERICPACGAAIPPGRKFCGSCGQALAPPPPAVQRFGSPQSYTPKHLAEKILTSKAAVEGERKQVTVLFADLRGSMELLADRDPEEARKILDPVLELMMEAVHRYEGTVNQVMGDGIMALFGAPLAHEDHAVRACYTALRMQESIKRYAEEVHRAEGIPIQIRVGLNSGEVVVRSIGSDLHMDYTAVGQTTHLAARMEQMAVPGSILISPATRMLAEGFVVVKPLGQRPVKGLDTPIDVHELVGASAARSRLQAAAARGLTRFVGRDGELDCLRLALERARAGHGQVVAVVGEPGVGKSRLYWEFTHSHRTEGWLILESSGLPYTKSISYTSIVTLLKGYFQIDAGAAAREIRERVTGKVLTLDEGLRETVPPILALLDALPRENPFRALGLSLRRARTMGALKQLLVRESERQPLCLLVEDLHWIDAESQAALDLLVESIPARRVLLLTNYRSEYEDHWMSKTYHMRIRLDALPPESVGELLDSLLGQDTSVGALKALVMRRSEGNPFFIEETVHNLVETGALVGQPKAYRLAEEVHTLEIPSSVQALVAARIDRLPDGDKRLLQTAAVIGKDAPVSLLRATVDLSEDDFAAGLARLQAAEFLYETRLFPESEYSFKHVVTHDVAYESLLLERRRTLHRRAGMAIEKLHGDRLAEVSETLAVHFERGGVWAQAAKYYLRAAEKAEAQFAFDTAARFCGHALEIMEKAEGLGDDKIRALVLLGDLWSFMDNLESANRNYEEALAASTDPIRRRWIENKRHRPHSVMRDQAKIAFYEHGSGDVTLILAMALTYGLATFQPVLDQLCQEFRIITIDARGTGSSDALRRPYFLGQHMEDIHVVLETLGTAPLVGIGVSRGANLLVQLSAAYPSLLQKLILIGPSLSWDRPTADKAREILLQTGLEAALRFWMSLVYSEPGMEHLVEQFVKIRLQHLPEETIRSFFDRDPEYDIRPLLSRVSVPTLVMRGTVDQACPLDDARTVVEDISEARFYEFSGKGHLPLFTATSEFCDVVRQFVTNGRVELKLPR